jgi:hypothetical protein
MDVGMGWKTTVYWRFEMLLSGANTVSVMLRMSAKRVALLPKVAVPKSWLWEEGKALAYRRDRKKGTLNLPHPIRHTRRQFCRNLTKARDPHRISQIRPHIREPLQRLRIRLWLRVH